MIEIKLSKVKTVFFFVTGVIFVIIGYLGAVKPEGFVSIIFRSPEMIRIFSIAAVCFFGVCLVFIARTLFDSKPGLIIDQSGITDNTSATSVGLIDWEDISAIEVQQVMSTRFLILHTNDPEKYIQRASNFLSRKAMEMNLRKYGSPLSIGSNSLKISFKGLKELIEREYEKHR